MYQRAKTNVQPATRHTQNTVSARTGLTHNSNFSKQDGEPKPTSQIRPSLANRQPGLGASNRPNSKTQPKSYQMPANVTSSTNLASKKHEIDGESIMLRQEVESL